MDSLDPAKTCVLFFDTTNTFVAGPSDRSAAVQAAVANWQRLQAAARERNMMVAYASSQYRLDGADFYRRKTDTDMRLTPLSEPGSRQMMAQHIVGTRGVEVIDDIAPRPGEYVFAKARWSPFFGTSFELSLRTPGIDTLVVAGGSTEIGISATSYAAQSLDFDLVIVSDGVTSNHADCQDALLRKIFPRFARVRTTDEVLEMLER